MNRYAAAILAGAISMGVYPPAAPAQERPEWKDFQNLMNSAAYGYTSMTGKGFAHIALPDATLRYTDGTTISIAEWKKRVAESFEAVAGLKSAFKLLEVEVEVPRAKITYTVTLTYKLKAEMEHTYQTVSRWSAMLTKTRDPWSNGWRVKQFMELSEETTCDGKPVPPSVSVPKW